jgi:hypothetical protein
VKIPCKEEMPGCVTLALLSPFRCARSSFTGLAVTRMPSSDAVIGSGTGQFWPSWPFDFPWSWSWSSSCGRQSVDQFVCVSGLPLGPLTTFYLTLLFSADTYLIIISKASSLTRKRVCSLQWNHSLVQITILYCLI